MNVIAKLYIALFVFLNVLSFHSFSQKRQIDSLDRIILSEKETEKKAKALNNKSRLIGTNDPVSCIRMASEALLLSKKLNYMRGIYDGYRNIGIAYIVRAEYDNAIAYLDSSLAITDVLKDKKLKGEALLNLGSVYFQFGKFDKALDLYFSSKNLFLELNDSSSLLRCYNNIGNVFFYLANTNEALNHFREAETLGIKLNDKVMLVKIYNGLGVVYITKKELDKALGYFKLSEEANSTVGDKQSAAGILYNIGSIYLEQNKFSDALLSFHKYCELSQVLGDKKGVCNGYGSMAECYKKLSDYDNALLYFNKQLAIADTLKLYKHKMIALFGMADVYEAKKDYKAAYEYHKKALINKDSVSNQTMNLNIAKITAKLENEKADKERELKQMALEAEHKAEIKKQKIITSSVILALILSLFLIYFIFRNFSHKKKANQILELKNRIIEEKQKEIIDSINYAKRIQYTLLAHQNFLQQHIPNHFVLFKPKDIVSGDFYWAAEHNNKFYLAVCDSTGHGVPGAFMSLLNIGFLSEAIKEKNISEPNKVLDYVRNRLVQSISREGQKDGMDAILICIDEKRKSLTYAAANNEPVMITDGVLTVYDKDKMPVGKGEREQNFKLFNLPYQKNTQIYLFTDGFADQFGGPKGKKFKYKQLNDLILASSHLPLNDQKEKLIAMFEEWKGDLEQVDDVCIIGIRL